MLNNNELKNSIGLLNDTDSFDVDPLFTTVYNIDFDQDALGITRSSFITAYYQMIKICVEKRKLSKTVSQNTNNGYYIIIINYTVRLKPVRIHFLSLFVLLSHCSVDECSSLMRIQEVVVEGSVRVLVCVCVRACVCVCTRVCVIFIVVYIVVIISCTVCIGCLLEMQDPILKEMIGFFKK